MTIEEQLKNYILTQYKSVREFCMQNNIPYSTVDSIFKRGILGSSVSVVNKICDRLNIDVDELINGNIIEKINKSTPNQSPSYEEMERLIEQAEQGNVGQHTLAYGGLLEEDEVTKTLNALEQLDSHSRDEYNILMELMNSKSGAVVFGYDAGEWKRETLTEKEAEVVFNLLHTLRK